MLVFSITVKNSERIRANAQQKNPIFSHNERGYSLKCFIILNRSFTSFLLLPRGVSAPGVSGIKNKNAVQVQSLHSKEESPATRPHRYHNKTALYKKSGLSYNIQCGAALGRCVGGCVTYAGFAGAGNTHKAAAFLFSSYIIPETAILCKGYCTEGGKRSQRVKFMKY